jgi:hypothetical protein
MVEIGRQFLNPQAQLAQGVDIVLVLGKEPVVVRRAEAGGGQAGRAIGAGLADDSLGELICDHGDPATMNSPYV